MYIWLFIYKKDDTIITTNTQKVIYQIKTTESLETVYELIEENATLYDSIKNINIGKVIKKEYEPSVRYAVDQIDKEIIATQIDNKIDITLTIEADANITDKLISVNDYELKVGKDAYIKGKGYAGRGYIISIER